MSRSILNVIVEKISLLKGEKPAVASAGVKFALVKMRTGLSESQKLSLQKSIETLEAITK